MKIIAAKQTVVESLRDQRQITGVLLYPTVGISLALQFEIQGLPIHIVTIDLNANWCEIRQQLLKILKGNFNE